MDNSRNSKSKYSDSQVLSELQRRFIYYPETGVFINRKTLTETATATTSNGYIVMRIFKLNYALHRLAWLWAHGEFPIHDLDHIDANRKNNKIANLQLATRSQNMSARTSRNKFGLKGVICHPNENRVKRFGAMLTKNYKRIWLGWHETPELAHESYCMAARELNGSFARDGAVRL